jgi:hypothetical protein
MEALMAAAVLAAANVMACVPEDCIVNDAAKP